MHTDPNDPNDNGSLSGQMFPGAYHVYFTALEDSGLNFGIHGTANFGDWNVDPASMGPRPDLGSGEGWTTMEAIFPTEGLDRLYTRLWVELPSAEVGE